MDEAEVIQLHGRDGAEHAEERPARRRVGQRRPGEQRADASIYPLRGDPGVPEQPAEPKALVGPAWERRLAEGLAFLRRRIAGDYAVDDFGFDADLTATVILPMLKPLYDQWFRVEVNGVENIPADGGALLVANHAGGLWPLDSAMTAVAVHEHTAGKHPAGKHPAGEHPAGEHSAGEHSAGRHLRLLAADLVFAAPGLGTLARKGGATLACNPDAERLLAAGELVGVWPEGFKGIGKPFRDRYQLQRFGRGGFVHLALKTGVPIVPVSIVGSEEIHPVLANVKPLARVLDLPYFPLTPTFPWLGPLGLVPLPSKWYIEFGEPIPTVPYGRRAAQDPIVIFDLADQVSETIQATLYRLLGQRRSVWR